MVSKCKFAFTNTVRVVFFKKNNLNSDTETSTKISPHVNLNIFSDCLEVIKASTCDLCVETLWIFVFIV